MQSRIPSEKAAALHILGPIQENPLVSPFVHERFEDGGWIDFRELTESERFDSLSSGEKCLVWAAASVYGNRAQCDIGDIAAYVDDASWRRVVEGLLMLRGLGEELHVQPGQWIDGRPS